MRQHTILVCDDETALAEFLTQVLHQNGYKTIVAQSGQECLNSFNDSVDLVLLDVKLPDTDGISVLSHLRSIRYDCKVLMITGVASPELAVKAMQEGATDFISKPFHLESLLATIKSMLTPRTHDAYHEVLSKSESPAVQSMMDTIRRVGPKPDVSVIIRGESGSGKEYVAHLLHALSPRASHPIIPVNCPALPLLHMDSELFGHEKGAFPGAEHERIGLVEKAHQSTLFLDEIAELPDKAQVKILRTIQEKEVRPLGADRSRHIDFRVLASTTQDLAKAQQENSFRPELYYRLADVEISVPPLRNRLEDLPNLIHLFCQQYGIQNNEAPRAFEKSAIEKLSQYDWPGNIRELRSFVRRICVLTNTKSITARDLREEFFINRPHTSSAQGKPLSQGSSKKLTGEVISTALRLNHYNVTRTAKSLGTSRSTLYRQMKKHGLSSL